MFAFIVLMTTVFCTDVDGENMSESVNFDDRPYRYGERTRDLKNAILLMNQTQVSDSLLEEQNGTWRVQQKGGAQRVVMQGVSKRTVLRRNVLARTEDGKWHRLLNVTDAFREHLATLPMQYEDMTGLAYDGAEWFGYNCYGECRRFVLQGTAHTPRIAYVLNEDGVWHLYHNAKELLPLREYIFTLPVYSSQLHRARYNGLGSGVNDTRESWVAKGDIPDWRHDIYAPPDTALREIFIRKRVMTNADNRLAKDLKGFSVVDPDGRYRQLLVEGLGVEKKEGFLFVCSDDGVWYKFRNVTRRFKEFVKRLPKQYDFGTYVYDGELWYVRDKFGRYEQCVSATCKGITMRFQNERGDYYFFKMAYNYLKDTVY